MTFFSIFTDCDFDQEENNKGNDKKNITKEKIHFVKEKEENFIKKMSDNHFSISRRKWCKM